MISVKLKTLTPLHIGSGRELARDVEFIEMKKEIGVIDERKILELIGEENIGTWVAKIEKQEPLLDYLKIRKPDVTLRDVSKYTMPLFANNFRMVKTLKEQLHDGMGRPLIPGSSIKGAIRTVILNIVLKELNHNWKEYELKGIRENNLQYTSEKKLNSLRFTDKSIQSTIFGRDPNHDFMRFVKLGDALFSNEDLITLSVLSLNYLNGKTKRDEKLLQLTEAIGADAETTFRMKLDLDLWQKNIDFKEIRKNIPGFLKDLPSLFKALNSFTIDLLKGEIEFWKEDKNLKPVEDYMQECEKLLQTCKNCNDNEAVLRLGHGSGWLFMTGGWIKNPDFINDQGTDNLYDKIIDKTRPANFRYK
ncbi:MAG TPA: type III-A CRISPR-associated RAMP protein Csm5, partial [Mariniphaga anaerophila]|nr:type III-A CRISPR-associated RAMP protein Csm5 [Mariniphaga anaerophila]